MLHAGLDLSRRKLDVCLLSDAGEIVDELAVPPDADGLLGLVRRVGPAAPQAVIESMTGARFVHDRLEELGWDVRIADAARVKGIGPLACKTDKIDARVLAILSQRDLIPEIWLPSLEIRQERELARFRLHLVKHRSMLKHRVHATLVSFGKPCTVTDLFGVAGRRMLADLQIPEPWRSTLAASVVAIDQLEAQIDTCNRQLRAMRPDHKYVPTLMSAPGIGWVWSSPGSADRSRCPSKRGNSRSTSPAGSPEACGTCSPTTNPSPRRPLPEAPLFVWPLRRPFWTCAHAAGLLHHLVLPAERAIET